MKPHIGHYGAHHHIVLKHRHCQSQMPGMVPLLSVLQQKTAVKDRCHTPESSHDSTVVRKIVPLASVIVSDTVCANIDETVQTKSVVDPFHPGKVFLVRVVYMPHAHRFHGMAAGIDAQGNGPAYPAGRFLEKAKVAFADIVLDFPYTKAEYGKKAEQGNYQYASHAPSGHNQEPSCHAIERYRHTAPCGKW